eukprot:5979803-Pleurochrysis_carterae.AAC.1
MSAATVDFLWGGFRLPPVRYYPHDHWPQCRLLVFSLLRGSLFAGVAISAPASVLLALPASLGLPFDSLRLWHALHPCCLKYVQTKGLLPCVVAYRILCASAAPASAEEDANGRGQVLYPAPLHAFDGATRTHPTELDRA